MATASSRGISRIWGTESGKELAVLRGHAGTIRTVAFSGDGERVLTLGSDNSTRIWDVASGTEIAFFRVEGRTIFVAAFSDDGKRLVAGFDDGTVRIWDVTWATLIRGDDLRERVCAEKLIGAAQEFTDSELELDPTLRRVDKDDPIARNPCLRRGPMSLDYWRRLPGQLWRAMHGLAGMN